MGKFIITEEEKKQILQLYSLIEQDVKKNTYQLPSLPNDMQAPLQTKPLKTNAGKYSKFVPTDKSWAPFLGPEGKLADLNIAKSFAPKPGTYNTQSEWYNQVSINILSTLEEYKIGKGYSYTVNACGKCKVTVSDTFLNDKQKNQFCGNRDLQNNKTWNCEDSMGILRNSYGTLDVSVLTGNGFLRGKNGIPQYVSPTQNFWNEYKHDIMLIGSLGSLIIPLAGPYLSLLFDAADVLMYLQEGDKEMAGLMSIFALIPLGQIGKLIGKSILPESAIGLVKRMHGKLPLTKLDKQILESIGKNSEVLSRYVKMYGKRAVLYNLLPDSKVSLKMWIVLMMKLGKLGYPLTKVGIQIAGITYTYKKLYDLYKTKPEEFKKIEKQFDDNKPTNQVYNTLEETNRVTTDNEEKQFMKEVVHVSEQSVEELEDMLGDDQ